MVDRTNCTHFEFKEIGEKGKHVKIPSCKIGKMKGFGGCEEYCEWFETIGPEIPKPPAPPEPPEPLKPL
jgi:hypothetical protein